MFLPLIDSQSFCDNLDKSFSPNCNFLLSTFSFESDNRPAIESAVNDFPLPDSPTIATISFGKIEKLNSDKSTLFLEEIVKLSTSNKGEFDFI